MGEFHSTELINFMDFSIIYLIKVL